MSNRFWNEFTADQWCRTDGDIVAPLSPDPGQREFNRERTEQQFVGNGPVYGLGVPGPAFNAESHRRMAEGWKRVIAKAKADAEAHRMNVERQNSNEKGKDNAIDCHS